jgi:DNA-directed RNA polymerase subunit RPC12/RpoP
MNEFKFNCPHCNQHLQCDEQHSGREIQCPSCNVLLRIPPVPGNTANYTPESGMTWATFVQPGKVTPLARPSPNPNQNPGGPAAR